MCDRQTRYFSLLHRLVDKFTQTLHGNGSHLPLKKHLQFRSPQGRGTIYRTPINELLLSLTATGYQFSKAVSDRSKMATTARSSSRKLCGESSDVDSLNCSSIASSVPSR